MFSSLYSQRRKSRNTLRPPVRTSKIRITIQMSLRNETSKYRVRPPIKLNIYLDFSLVYQSFYPNSGFRLMLACKCNRKQWQLSILKHLFIEFLNRNFIVSDELILKRDLSSSKLKGTTLQRSVV